MEYDLFKVCWRLMELQDEGFCDACDYVYDTIGSISNFHQFIDEKFPGLSKYITFEDDDEDYVEMDVSQYMQEIGAAANNYDLVPYLVANYLAYRTPHLAEEFYEEMCESLEEQLKIEDGIDEEFQRMIIEKRYRSDEEVAAKYKEIDCIATRGKKVNINKVIVNNNMGILFDRAKNSGLETTLVTDIKERKEADMETINSINTEQYAKLLVEYIKTLLARASEMNRTSGYLIARDFDKFSLGRLKHGDRKSYYDEYSADNNDYLISSRTFNDYDKVTSPSFNTLDYFYIDGDTLTLRLNFSSDTSSDDSGYDYIKGGIPKYNDLYFDYLKQLLLNEDIEIEKESINESKDGGWTNKRTDILTIKYYRYGKTK